MAYLETPQGAVVTLDLNADGTLRAANVERRIGVTVNGEARPDIFTRDVLTADTLTTVLPDHAALLLRVQSLETDLAAMTKAREDLQKQLGAVPPVASGVPQSVSPLQARKALMAAGLLDDIDALIAASPREAQLAWDYALSVERSSPLIAQLAGAIGLTGEQIDGLFVAAAGM